MNPAREIWLLRERFDTFEKQAKQAVDGIDWRSELKALKMDLVALRDRVVKLEKDKRGRGR